MPHSTRPMIRLFVTLSIFAASSARADSPYAAFKNGPSTAEDYFPIAVWLQSPAKAAQYQAIGINTYVGIWRTPTAEQLAELQKHGIAVVCHYRPELKEQKNVIGWMHG